VEKAVVTSAICCEMERYRSTAGTATSNDYVTGIAAELPLISRGQDVIPSAAYLANVFLDPLHGFSLISQTVVSAGGFRGLDFLASNESVGPDAVMRCNDYDATVRGSNETGSICICPAIIVEAACWNEE
jgi:hypothetical protein